MERRSIVSLGLSLLLVSTAVSAVAQPRGEGQTVDRERVMRREVMKDNGVARLFATLPASFVLQPPVLLEIKVVQAERTLVREMLDIDEVPKGPAVIEILNGHSKEVERLHAVAAQQPGTVKVVITSGDEVVSEVCLDDLETGKTVTRPPIGHARLFTISINAPRLKAVTQDFQPDPDCAQACYDDWYFCETERCDQRGSCAYCDEYYQDCYYSCPQVCVDPKNVYNWNSVSYQGSSWLGQNCYENWFTGDVWGDLWTHYIDVYQVTPYQRTEYCNGTYTDVQTGSSYYYYDDCWSDTYPNGCTYPSGNPPYNQCQFTH
jgi:hypothetical protein